MKRVIAILDHAACGARWSAFIRGVASAPCELLLRARGAPRDALHAAVGLAQSCGAEPWLNVGLAQGPAATLAQARSLGVRPHLPQHDFGPVPGPWGASVHDLESARRAASMGARYLLFAPVFEPRSKPGRAAGLEALAATCAATAVPVYALGGVTAQNTGACLEAGAYGVASLGGLSNASDPAAELAALMESVTCR